MDTVTQEQRSLNMSHIRSKDTKVEVKVRKYLFSQGFRYRKNDKRFPGKPDIVLPKYKTVIFIHGCFWHQHEDCPIAHIPKSNVSFWQRKFSMNRERDERNKKELISMGLQVIIVWECTVNKMKKDDSIKENILADIINAIKNGEDLYYEF